MPAGTAMAAAPQQPLGNSAADQQNYLNLMMNMLSGQMGDSASNAAAATIDNCTSIPVGQATTGGGHQGATSGKKKKGGQGKNRGANHGAATAE